MRGLGWFSIGRGHYLSDLLVESGDLVCNDIPNDVFVESKIPMRQNVAESRNLAPFDFSIPISNSLGNLFRGLSEYKQIP